MDRRRPPNLFGNGASTTIVRLELLPFLLLFTIRVLFIVECRHSFVSSNTDSSTEETLLRRLSAAAATIGFIGCQRRCSIPGPGRFVERFLGNREDELLAKSTGK
jgi:hypothetical protein